MARINLLPWREAERKRRQREFAMMLATGLGATVLLGFGAHLHIDRLISLQQDRNAYLQNEIGEFNGQIKEIQDLEKTRANLLARMKVIQLLEQSRPEIVHLFDELVNAIPEGVYLTKFDQTDRVVVVQGRARSDGAVSAFMRNIEASKWIENPRLLLIEHKDQPGTGFRNFRLEFSQSEPDKAEAQPG